MPPRRRRKSEPLDYMSIRLDADVKAALLALAESQERSLSWIANKALKQWVQQHAAEIAAAKRDLEKK
jgi:predicted transcriptional regulator